jgi:hypothetical protein
MKSLPFILVSVILCLSASLMAQPINDNCPTATSLVVSCTAPVAADVSGATQSDTGLTCSGYTSVIGMDVWFSFVAISGSMYNITVVPSSDFDAVIQLRTGTCASQVAVDCEDNQWEGGTEVLTFTAASTGTYYIKVYPYRSVATPPTTTTFSICVATTLPGIEEKEKEPLFSVYPNPSTGLMKIHFSKLLNDASLTIYNSMGKKIYLDKVSVDGNLAGELKLKEIPGVYFMEIKKNDDRYTQKLVIQ